MSKEFTHINKKDVPYMVSVQEKKATNRMARARATVLLNEEILNQFEGNEIATKKGPVFQTAIIAGILGAKKTGDLIPLCHPIGMDHCEIDIQMENGEVLIDCVARVKAKTGIEMEALTGATIAALTINDMCKSFGHEILIKDIKLMEKRGGKKDFLRQ